MKETSASGGVVGALKAADRFCFGYGSPTTLGVLRILIGFLAAFNWILIGIDWESWYSEKGYVPNYIGSLWLGNKSAIGLGTNWQIPRLNLLSGITDPRITIPFYILVIVAAVFTCLGLGTRVAAFVLAVGTVTLQTRNGPLLHGGDTVLRIAVIYLAVSPCGQACSLDRLIGIWKNWAFRGQVKSLLTAQRLIQYNVALIYFTTLWLKWDGGKWHNFTAIYYPERLAEFYRFPVPEFIKSAFMAHVLTFMTVLTEFSLGTLIFFRPLRKWVILGGILMHSYIEYSMNIPLFSFQMISLYLAFYDGEEVQAWAERQGQRLRRFHVAVMLPAGMQFQPRAVAFFDAIDPFKLVSYRPGHQPTWQATRLDGTPIPLERAIAGRSVGSWIFVWIPGLLKRLISQSLMEIPHEDSDSQPAEQVQDAAITKETVGKRRNKGGRA